MVAAVCDGYQRGLADAVEGTAVHRAIRLTAAAKYFWLAPRMLTQLADRNTNRAHHYGSRDDFAMFAGRRKVFELLASWARLALR